MLVLVPDLKQIEPLVRSVFPHVPNQEGVYLPVKIAGVTQLDAVNAWRAVLGRIELVEGRFTIEDFADWLNLNATQLRYALNIQNTERMIALLISAGFKRGLDDAHLQRGLSSDDEDYRFSFKFALDRLVLGVAIPEHAMFENTLSYAQVLPSDFELISTLITIYQDFAERRHWMTAHELGLQSGLKSDAETWLKMLMQDILEFEQAGVEALKTVREIVKKQERMLTLASFYDEQENSILKNIHLPLPYLLTEIQNILEGQIDQALPTGQITFSQIGLIRPLPYKLIVVMNLDSGKFPNRSTHLPFDLMEILKPQLGDRSRLEDDQGAFLDALLLAQENLWLFYNGFDVSDGEVRDPSSVLQELIQHIAFISQSESSSSEQTNTIIEKNGIEIPEQILSLYHIHGLQPFDPSGFETAENIRYQDQWYQVAQQIRQADNLSHREAWANTTYPVAQDSLTVLDAGQWIHDVTFPARLYLKTLGVENLSAEDIPTQIEPLVLDGLARYQIRDFLQKQDLGKDILADQSVIHNIEQLQNQLQDQLPIGKVQHSAWQISLAEQETLNARLKRYAAEVTRTTQRQWRIEDQLVINITVPMQAVKDWVSLDASSGRAKRRTKVWLEYLLWLSYLDLDDAQSLDLRRIALFSDVTVISTGITSKQAKAYLLAWFKAYAYAQSQPLVLPAALLLKLAEKNKALEWFENESGQMVIDNLGDLFKEWNAEGARFSSFSVEDNEATRFHRDWQFILQEQDATALLKHACEQFAYDLYQPIYQHQYVEEE